MDDEFVFVGSPLAEEGYDFWEGAKMGFALALLAISTIIYTFA